MSKPLSQKTVRPGSLNNYSFYYSNRDDKQVIVKSKRFSYKKLAIVLLIVGVVGFSLVQSNSKSDNLATIASNNSDKSQTTTLPASKKSSQKTAPAAVPPSAECASNTLPKFIFISIGDRKLTACEGSKAVYSAPIITGDERHAETETPEGTYKIFAKEHKVTLKGADSKGSWSFPVDNWMPFLDNKYGTYGFHDAGWKDVNDFGNIDPYTNDKASHGCVEMTKEASAWLYSWAPVGTTLTIKA